MAIVKITKSGYKSKEDMKNLINYVIDGQRHKTDGLVGGTMVLAGSAHDIYGQMMDVKRHYQKTDGYMMRHIIISLSDVEMKYIDSKKFYVIATQVCRLFPDYQSVFAIHLEKDCLHLHLAINTVSYIDGKKLQIMPIRQIQEEISGIISFYLPKSPDRLMK